jgi:hypothetical protein
MATLQATGRVKDNKTASILGYDYKQLQKHIESHPNWDNVKNNIWHVDHIFPIKAFLDHSIYDFKIINALDNLQPLSQHANNVKGAKYSTVEFVNWLKHKGI